MCRHYRERMSRERNREWVGERNRERGKVWMREDPRFNYAETKDGQQPRFKRTNWRDKADISSFYFTRFPEDVNEKDLWYQFKRWGDVREIFICKQRNKSGRRYGFVRFKG